MSSSTNKTIKGMPTLALTKIIGKPTYEAIKILNNELSVNSASIFSNIECVIFNQQCLIVTPAVYVTLSSAPVVTLLNPAAAEARDRKETETKNIYTNRA